MAQSGTITINAWSVDNGSGDSSYWNCGSLPSGTCYTSGNKNAFGRGHIQANISLNFTVNNSNLLSISYGSTSYVHGPWYVCSVQGYHIDVDFSEDQVHWSTIMSSFANDWPTCVVDNNHKVETIASQLASGLTPVVLTKSGYVRIRMWTASACPTCGGVPSSEVWPNAFPNDAASEATAVPIYIEVDYRPGEVLTSGTWKSTNRSGGKCHLRSGGSWVEMKTSDGGTGTGNPPSRRTSGTWKNQYKIGSD